MKIHCFQHVPFEGPASILTWVEKNNHRLTYTKFYNNDPLPLIDEVDFLIVMGGPMSFDDDEKYEWMKSEKLFIKKALEKGKTMLGICLGAQFIADVIDGSARHKNSKEIGWFPISFTKERFQAGIDFLPESTEVFHWHGDTFEIPKGAVRLAYTEEYPNQAFLYENNIIGLQFHLEVVEDSVNTMVEAFRYELEPDRYVQDEDTILSNTANISSNNVLMWKILDFLERRTVVSKN